MEDHPYFREEQRPDQWWVWLLIVFVTVGAWVAFILQVIVEIDPRGEPFSNDLIAWLVLIAAGIALPLLFILIKLTVTVTPEQMTIHFAPFVRKMLRAGDIEHAYVRTYKPIREYDGWGIRWHPRNGWAYNMTGGGGVQLELTNGTKLLIGTRRPHELEQALELMLSSGGSS